VRAPLAVRIYLLWLTTVLLIAVTIALVVGVLARPHRGPRFPDYIAGELARHVDDPQDLAAAVARVHEHLGDEVTLYDTAGRLLHSTSPTPPAPLDPDAVAQLGQNGARGAQGRFVAPMQVDGRLVGYAMLRPPGGPPRMPTEHIAMALVVVLGGLAIASLVLARRITRPLGRLAAAARALGAGDLQARVGPLPRGEFAELGASFDEMAGRVHDLLQAQRALLANVSHELRTPIARIRVALDLGAEGDPSALEGLVDDLAQLERLIGDILTAASLDLARPGDATSPLRREPIDLGRLLDRTAAAFRAAFPSHRLELRRTDEVVLVDADAALLRRVLDNLLDNARKYSEPGTRVLLALAVDDERVRVEVQDEGIGIDARDLPQLFTPFFRTDRSRARTTGGVGLGLTLARRIVVAHEGTLDIASRSGEGTTVRVTLPRLPT